MESQLKSSTSKGHQHLSNISEYMLDWSRDQMVAVEEAGKSVIGLLDNVIQKDVPTGLFLNLTSYD